jgi:hypothetical protein
MSLSLNDLSLDKILGEMKLSQILQGYTIHSEDMVSFKAMVDAMAKSKSNNVLPNQGPEMAAIVYGKLFSEAKTCINIKAKRFQGSISNRVDYISGLIKAINKNVTFNIIVNDPNITNNHNSIGLAILKNYVESKKINFRYANPELKNSDLFFCTVDDDMYRYEYNNVSHQAAFCFNDPGRTRTMIDIFNELFEASNPINF